MLLEDRKYNALIACDHHPEVVVRLASAPCWLRGTHAQLVLGRVCGTHPLPQPKEDLLTHRQDAWDAITTKPHICR